ncbi:MAG: leucine-rich repeat domain-containing protein, partial [Clostridia bacterium]|nr:leucine-rich repeat domain-containing protein [Clostridia bacterium]
MRNGKTKLYLLIAITAAIALLSLTSAAFALFYRNIDLPVEGETATASIVFTEAELTGSAIFAEKGDTYYQALTVQNTGSVPVWYTLDFTLIEGGLEQAILFYLDGAFLGTLDGFFAEGQIAEMAMEHPLAPGESATHALSLEYHLGANSYYAVTDKDFTLQTGAHATQLFAQTDHYLFADDFYQFAQIVEHYSYSGYTVQLTGDIVMERHLTVSAPLSINLAGHTLTLGDYDLRYDHYGTEVARLYNSRAGGGIVRGSGTTGNVRVITPNSYLKNEVGTEYIIITAASETVFVNDYEVYLETVFQRDLTPESNLAGDFGDYFTYFGFTLSSSDNAVVNANLEIVTPDFTSSVALTFGFSGAALNFHAKVCGSDADSIAETVLRNNFYILPQGYVMGTVLPISGDVLLPTRDKNTGNPILWISSARETLDETGKFQAPYINTAFELSAVVTVNGVNILKVFPMSAVAKSAEEKLNELILDHGAISFVQYEQSQPLPFLDDYDYMGLEAISFEIPANVQDVFIIVDELDGSKSLRLMGNTDIQSSYLTVTATFGGVTVSGEMEIKINVMESISYWDSAFRLVMSYVALVGTNTMESFDLPSNYRTTTTIEYFVYGGPIGPIYTNPVDVEDYCIPKPDNTGITIIKEKLPQENTMVTVEVKITYDEVIEYRYFRVSVAGVLHYSEEDIADINLYQELRRIYDGNDDWIITRDEIDASSVTEFTTGAYHNIASVKGLEFFTNLTSIDVSNNNIIDISPLSELYNLEHLNLASNSVLDIEALQNLTKLITLDLSYNSVTDIDSLKNKAYLDTLILAYNPYLSDFSAVVSMPALTTLNVYNTSGATSDEAKNNNVLITAYQNAAAQSRTLYIYKTSTSSAWGVTGTMQTANNIVNAIEPIYEFYNVIYLPPMVVYNETGYLVTWQCSHPDIISISGQRAYITRPLADVEVKLSANITHSNYTLTRFFDVVSREDTSSTPLVYNGSGNVDAFVAIPDDALRYYLFKKFDTNPKNNIIEAAEIAAPSGDVDLTNLGVQSLEGIQYFASAINSLDLRNNNFADLTLLGNLVHLTSLSINGAHTNLDVLESLDNLVILNVHGLNEVNSNDSLSILYNVYLNNPGIMIYKNSLNDVWDPFVEPMAKALTNLMPYQVAGSTEVPQYLLYAGSENELLLKQFLNVTMYNESVRTASVNYSRQSGSFSLNGNVSVFLNHTAMPSRDEYGQLQASITIEGTTVSRTISVISVSDTELYVEIYDAGTDSYSYQPLTSAVPNERARSDFISRLNNTTGPDTMLHPVTGQPIRYLSRANYLGIGTLTFQGQGMYGLKGVELLKGSASFNRINYTGFIERSSSASFDTAGYVGLEVLNNVDFPSLRNLYFYNSVVDLFDLGAVSNLTNLYFSNCTKVVMDKVVGQDRVSVFSSYPNLNYVYMVNCNVRDFWAIQVLAVTTLYLYSNDASLSALTDYYVEQAYANLNLGTTINYRIISSGILWQPKALNIQDLGVTYESGGAPVEPYPYGVTYFELSALQTLSFRLPLTYLSATPNITWTAVAGGAAYTQTDFATYKVITFSRPSLVTTYTRLAGTIVDSATSNTIATVEYLFVSLLDAGVNAYINGGGTDYFNIRVAMMEDAGGGDQFADFRFAYYLLGELTDENGSGTYARTEVESFQYLEKNAPNNSSVRDVFYNIKGIRYFTGLRTIYLNYHAITDVGEVYYLSLLERFRMEYNRINSLRTIGGTSIFYNMSALTEIQVANNPGINDFLPIAERANTTWLQNLSLIRVYQADQTYFPITVSDGNLPLDTTDDDPEHIIAMAKAWWLQRVNSQDDSTLYLVSGQEMDTKAEVTEFFDCIGALEQIPIKTGINVGSSLGATVDYNSTSYPIYWVRHGSSNAITVTSAGIVESISTELAATNHFIKMQVYTVMSTTGHSITRMIYVGLSMQGNYEDADLKVELLAQEATAYTQTYGYTATYSHNDATNGDIYTIYATDLIPDAHLRNYVFSQRDNSPRDGVMSFGERSNWTGTRWVTNRMIDDITGIELFYRTSVWIFNTGTMDKFPSLLIRADTELVRLGLQRNYNLTNLKDGLEFDGDGTGTFYTSLHQVLEIMDLQYAMDLSDEQYLSLASMPNLSDLTINANRYANLDVLHDLYDSLTRLSANYSNINYANFNMDQYRRLVLDSPGLTDFSAYSYVSTVFKEYLALELYQVNVPKALPSTFQLKGYDRIYDLSWSEIGEENNFYTISESGGVYYLTVETGAPQTVFVSASVSYSCLVEGQPVTYTNTYTEAVEIITLQDADLSNQYYRTSGFIWSETASDYVDIETVMPDPIL